MFVNFSCLISDFESKISYYIQVRKYRRRKKCPNTPNSKIIPGGKNDLISS